MPIYREAREELVPLLEDLTTRRISYSEFRDRSWRLSTLTDEGDSIWWPQDHGASAILDGFTVENYGNRMQKWENRDPKCESEETSCLIRCLLFLRGQWEYEWDSRQYDVEQFFYKLTDLLQRSPGVRRLFSRILPEQFEIELWPFCRLRDLKDALMNDSDYFRALFSVEL